MSRLFSISIRKLLILLAVLMAVVPLIIIVLSAIKQYKQDIYKATQLVDALADEVSNDQKVLLSGAEQLLSTLPYIPAIARHDEKASNALLAELVKKNPQLTNILMIDSYGLVWASALPMNGRITASDRRFFKNALATGKFSSGEFTIGRVLQKPTLSFGYPARDSSGQITNIATVAFTLTKYDRLLKMKGLPAGISLVMIDHRGTIIFDATTPQFIGKHDKEDIFKQMVDGPDEGTFEAVGITGKSRYFAYHKLRLPDEKTPYLYVRAGILKKAVLAKTRNELLVNVGLMLLLLTTFIFFAIYISKRGIVDKIITLRDAMHKVSEGNLNVRVSELVSGGEMGELGRSFDAMTCALIVDRRERTRAEEEIRSLNMELDTRVKERTAQLEAAIQEQESFSYSVSHDLRAPLRHLNSYSCVLLEEFSELLPAQACHYLNRIRNASSHMGKLIDDLLMLSRFGRVEMKPQVVNLSMVCNDIGMMLRETYQDRIIDFVVADNLTVRGDPSLLRMALQNMLENAWKYTANSPNALIECGVSASERERVFFIRDNGIGFDMKYHDKLFGAFQRLHVDEYEGTGIGLATVQRIIRRHGGKVWAESKTDQGSTFFFTLPGAELA